MREEMKTSGEIDTLRKASFVAWIVGAGIFVTPTASLGAQVDTDHVDAVEILPIAEETRLALSAAPEHLRARAGVWALTADGFVEVRQSQNGFTCVVNRDHPLNRKPTCYDTEGTRTILPKVRFMGELMLTELELDQIWAQVEAGFESGRFTPPARPGIAYMLSNEIRNYNPQTGSVGTFPPHLMFYGPNITNEDIGASFEARQQHPWLPFVGYQGPHGFIIVVIGDTES